MEFKVRVYDNFHYGDEDESDDVGTYATYEQAVTAARAIVVKSLKSVYELGMTPDQLYDQYVSFGDDPSVYPEDPSYHFSAWNYAKSMCKERCKDQEIKGS
jgi:hypothetical protein